MVRLPALLVHKLVTRLRTSPSPLALVIDDTGLRWLGLVRNGELYLTTSRGLPDPLRAVLTPLYLLDLGQAVKLAGAMGARVEGVA